MNTIFKLDGFRNQKLKLLKIIDGNNITITKYWLIEKGDCINLLSTKG